MADQKQEILISQHVYNVQLHYSIGYNHVFKVYQFNKAIFYIV